MTFAEALVAAAILTLFIAGISAAAKPVAEAGVRAERALAEARETGFVIESFRKACRDRPENFDEWRRAASSVEGVSDIEIRPYGPGGTPRAWRLTCAVFGRAVEVYAEGAQQ